MSTTRSQTTDPAGTPTPAPLSSTRRRLMAAAGVTTALVGAGVVWQSQIGTPSTGPSSVAVAAVTGVGDVLVDGQGKVLYLFEPDKAASVTCTGGCADKWPPLTVPGAAGEASVPTGPGVRPELLGSAESEDGASVVTYAGSPLYRYASDDPGEATGHDKDQNGGRWYAVTANGERVG